MTPTSLAVIGALTTFFTTMLGFATKLITDQRGDNKVLQDKMMDRAIPALEASAAASQAMVEATARVLEALAVVDDRRRR